MTPSPTLAPDPDVQVADAPPGMDPSAPVTHAILERVVDFINSQAKATKETFDRVGAFVSSLEKRVEELEGASPADRVVAAAIAARTELVACEKANQMTNAALREALKSMATPEPQAATGAQGEPVPVD